MTTILTTAKLAEALAPLIDSAHDAVDLTVAAGTPLVCDMLDGGASDQATVKQRWAGAIIKFGVEPSVTFGHVPTSGTFTKFSANEWSVKISSRTGRIRAATLSDVRLQRQRYQHARRYFTK